MQKKIIVIALLSVCQLTAAAEKHNAPWVGTWAASPMGMTLKADQPAANATYRSIVHTSVAGDTVRVQLTNEFGTAQLVVGDAHIAISSGSGAIQPDTDHALTFNGRPSVTIPRGAMVFSDPVPMKLPALSNVALSVYVPEQALDVATCHELALSTNFVTPGDTAAAASLSDAKPLDHWCFVKGIDVQAEKNGAAIVTLGDSITDGWHSTADANRRWPDVLAARLQAGKKTADLGVLNEAISGNRILHDEAGPNALARFDRDVLAQSGVKYLIILESINDIGTTAKPREPEDTAVTAQDLIFGLTQMATRAHEHGIKVFGATITPYGGAGYFSEAGEHYRQTINDWIRTSGVFDGVIDFDKTTRDPSNPTAFLPAYDANDHLHPNDAGDKAMGDSIDLSLFH